MTGMQLREARTRLLLPRALPGGAGLRLPPFELERFFAQHEFSAPHQLCNSDGEPLSVAELLEHADEDALQRWRDLKLAYTETQGLPALREAIAASSNYKTVEGGNVVVAAPSELITLAQMALLRPGARRLPLRGAAARTRRPCWKAVRPAAAAGDHVVVMRPGYQSLYEVAKSLGCEVSFWEPTLAPDGLSLSFNLGQLLAVLRDRETRLVVVNFPHNPTGFVPSRQQFQQIVAACRSCGAWLLSDEMWACLPPPVAAVAAVLRAAASCQSCRTGDAGSAPPPPPL